MVCVICWLARDTRYDNCFGLFADVYFVPVVNYLIFNSGDYLGRILAGMIEWVNPEKFHLNVRRIQYVSFQPRNKPYLVAFMSVVRIAFVPAIIVCNAKPRHIFPTLIHADYLFVILMGLFAFSNGYLANIALIWAPKYVLHFLIIDIHTLFWNKNITSLRRSVHSREREMASSIMAAFMGIGLAFGSSMSLILVQII